MSKMRIISRPSELSAVKTPVVLAVGFFDGVHRGHREVLDSAVRRAREINGEAWVMTFDQHPLALLAPYKKPRLLSTTDERLRIFAELEVDGVLLVDFDKSIAARSPRDFVNWLCTAPENGSSESPIVEIRCGDNWRFGEHAAGTPTMLEEFGQDYGFKVVIVPYAGFKGLEISSTRIRYTIREGRLEDANLMLGRPYAVHGRVVGGRGVANRLGIATANIVPAVDLLPPNGVYAVRIELDEESFGGVANLGVRPTFHDTSPDEIVLETHLFDFSGELYNREIVVCFLSFLRAERRFPSVDELVACIHEDMKQARKVLDL